MMVIMLVNAKIITIQNRVVSILNPVNFVDMVVVIVQITQIVIVILRIIGPIIRVFVIAPMAITKIQMSNQLLAQNVLMAVQNVPTLTVVIGARELERSRTHGDSGSSNFLSFFLKTSVKFSLFPINLRPYKKILFGEPRYSLSEIYLRR